MKRGEVVTLPVKRRYEKVDLDPLVSVNIILLTAQQTQDNNPYSAAIDLRRTAKVDPQTVRVKIFIMAVNR